MDPELGYKEDIAVHITSLSYTIFNLTKIVIMTILIVTLNKLTFLSYIHFHSTKIDILLESRKNSDNDDNNSNYK